MTDRIIDGQNHDDRAFAQMMRNLASPQPARTGRLVKSKRGSWGRILQTGYRAGCVGAISRAECLELGLTPGPANY